MGVVRAVNPTSLALNLEEVLKLGSGVTCLAETAVREGRLSYVHSQVVGEQPRLRCWAARV